MSKTRLAICCVGVLLLLLALVVGVAAGKKWQAKRRVAALEKSDPEFKKWKNEQRATEAELRRKLEPLASQLAAAYAKTKNGEAPYVLAVVLSRNCRLEAFERPLLRMVILRGPAEDGRDGHG